MSRPIDEYAAPVGHVTIAWNDMQFGIYIIFEALMHCPGYASKEMFFSLRTDSAQRDLCGAAVREVLAPINPDLAHRIIDRINAIGKDAGHRNDAIHAIWMVDWPRREISIFQEKNRLKKAGNPIKEQLEASTKRFYDHAVALHDLYQELLSIKPFSSPERRKMRNAKRTRP